MLKKILLAASLAIGLSIWGVSTAYAYTIMSEENAYLGSDVVVDGPLYVAGSTVKIQATVNGDVYCAGQTVEVMGTINGDVICAAQQIKIGGVVNGDVRVASQTLSIDGEVQNSITAFAQTIALGANSSIGSDATMFAQSASLAGNIGRDVVGGSGTTTVSGKIGGSILLDTQSLTFDNKAQVTGAVTYTSSNEATVRQGATVGSITRNDPPKQAGDELVKSTGSQIGAAFYWFMAMLLVGTVILLAKPRLLTGAAERVRTEPWVVLAWGLLAVFVVPLVAILLALTIIGVPLMLISLLAWLLVLALSTVFSGYALGWLILKQVPSKLSEGWLRFVSLALGLFILAVLSLIPIIGVIAGFASVIFGAGAALYLLRNKPAAAKMADGGKA